MRSSRQQLLIPIGIFLLALFARIIPGPRTIDDAFITYRYARNLIAGEGFLYNPGEQVLGTTTPLYTMIMASLGTFFGGPNAPFPALATGLNAIADAFTCLGLIALGRRLQAPLAGIGAGFVWAIAPYSVTFAIGGLETSLFVLLLVSIAGLHLKRKYVWSALLAGLALLTRPDALLLISPLAVDRLLGARKGGPDRIQWQEILAFTLPTLAWGAFATLYFGSPISHSVSAKTLAYRLPPTAAFVRLLQHYTTPFLGHLTFGIPWIGVGLILYPFLFLIGARWFFKQDRRSWPFILYPWLYFTTFAIVNPLIFRWYLTPPLPFYFLGILAGGERISRDLLSKWVSRVDSRSGDLENLVRQAAPAILIILIPTGLSLQDWTLHPDHGPDRPAPSMAWFQLELTYQQAAEYLLPQLSTDDTLAASDVGVLGYYTPARILDTVGLNSPEALKYYPINPDLYVINLATSPDLIMETNPDFLVLLEVYGRKGVFKDPRFLSAFDLVYKIPTDIYGSDGMLIYVRKEGS